MTETKHTAHQAPTGYLRTSTAASLIGTSRQWIYDLIATGRLVSEDKILPGRGFEPVKVVTLASFIEYVRGAEQYAGRRTAIINKARGEATKVKPVEFTETERADIRHRYVDLGQGCEPIAVAYQSSSGTIKKLLVNMGVKITKGPERYAQGRKRFADSLDPQVKEQIKTKFEAGVAPLQIAVELGWGAGQHGKVRRALSGMGCKLRTRSEARSIREKAAA
jgi:hypothetical protein